MRTLVSGDIVYLSFYLKEKDPLSGSISYYDITDAQTINLRLRKYGETVNAIETTCEVITGTLGYCRAKVTVPVVSSPTTYEGEVEVIEAGQITTWKNVNYIITPQLG